MPASVKRPKGKGLEAQLASLRAENAQLNRELETWRLRRAKASLQVLALVEFNNRVLGNLNSGLVAVDGKGRVSLINQAAASILGAELKAAKGKTLAALLKGLGPEAQTLAAALGSGGETLKGEACFSGPLGERRVQYSLTAFGLGPAGEPEGAVLLLADLTRVREQEARQQRQEQLAQVGRLSADIAHQLRNPLAGMLSLLQVSQGLPGASEALRQNLDMVIAEVRRLDRLVTDTLRFSRPVALSPEPVDLNAVASEALALALAPPRGRGVKVSRALHRSPLRVVADRDQLREVVLNLAVNALEAMPQGGSLSLATRLEKGSRGRMHQAVLTLRDSGSGIAPRVAPHIFDPFFTTKPQGSGLGLAACRRVVDALGGNIRFTSQTGKGTVFTVSLPAS